MPDTPSASPATPALDPQRWKALTFIGVAQLMVVLDATIVNIALPHTQTALHFSDANRQWVITAYSLAFGGLLLFGGRIGDLWGRKRAFLVGLTRQAAVHGYVTAFWWALAIMLLAALSVAVLLRADHRTPAPSSGADDDADEHAVPVLAS